MTNKPIGVTVTERMLSEFCERSFLKLWSYPNPYKDDGHELCDLLAVFGRHVFIFFDRHNELQEIPGKEPQVLWERWKRNVIDAQVRTAHGADRYIRSGRAIFTDGKRKSPFPFVFDRHAAIVHKIIVAHGAKEACARASPQNVYGSLGITYAESDEGPTMPFHIDIDRSKPVHILDSHNMPIVLRELDTVSDFADYLDEKVRAATEFDFMSYCGEEDLLAHYLMNYDDASKRHVIGSEGQGITGITIGEGDWHFFKGTELYKNTKNEDRVSYFWDDLIQRTCQNSLDGTLAGNSNIVRGESAIYEMVKEPRFMRRALSKTMLGAVERFPDSGGFTRQVTFLPSYQPNVGYVFLQLRAPDASRSEPEYREKRQYLLEIACGAAKNKFPNLVKVVGIGIESPKFTDGLVAEDFLLMPCDEWPDEMRQHYIELNEPWRFFGSPTLRQYEDKVTQFVPPSAKPPNPLFEKVGRNDPCPCGSGKKYKKCHG